MNIQPISFVVDGSLTLRGSVYAPKGGFEQGRTYPTAILFHGFGGNRIDFSGFIVQMARAVSDKGLAVITYDRAGHGESDGDFFDTSVTRDVHHALQVVDKVAELDFVDADNIHFGGISLGAVIASVTAARCACPPRDIVMCSTAAVFVDEIASGKIQGMPLNTLKTLGYFDFMGVKMGPAMVEDAKAFDPYKEAADFGGKVLLMHGTKDFVPVGYAKKYQEIYGEQSNLLIRDGADHGWASVPDREFVMSHAADFIAENAWSGGEVR